MRSVSSQNSLFFFYTYGNFSSLVPLVKMNNFYIGNITKTYLQYKIKWEFKTAQDMWMTIKTVQQILVK